MRRDPADRNIDRVPDDGADTFEEER